MFICNVFSEMLICIVSQVSKNIQYQHVFLAIGLHSCRSAGCRVKRTCPIVQHCPGSPWLTKGATHSVMPRRRPLYRHNAEKPTKKDRGQGGPARAHTEGTRIESESGHRVGEVGHPDWNEPNGTENVSSRWTRPSPTSPPNFNKVPFQPRDMEATGPRKGLEGCCDCGEHINFSNLSSNIKAPGFIFQGRLNTILPKRRVQQADVNRSGAVRVLYFKVHLNSHILGM